MGIELVHLAQRTDQGSGSRPKRRTFHLASFPSGEGFSAISPRFRESASRKLHPVYRSTGCGVRLRLSQSLGESCLAHQRQCAPASQAKEARAARSTIVPQALVEAQRVDLSEHLLVALLIQVWVEVHVAHEHSFLGCCVLYVLRTA